MNRQTRNAIALAIAPHTGHGRTRTFDYFQIIERIRDYGYDVMDKIADEYNSEMTHKHNAYTLEDKRTGNEIDCLLIIDEYFNGDAPTHEINAYIS